MTTSNPRPTEFDLCRGCGHVEFEHPSWGCEAEADGARCRCGGFLAPPEADDGGAA